MSELIQRTLVLLKPDAVSRALIGEIISRFERAGLKIVALKMLRFTREMASEFYIDSTEWLESVGKKAIKGIESVGIDVMDRFGTNDPVEIGKRIREMLIEFISSGPVVAMVVEGIGAIDVVRKLIGPTDPSVASPGTIRGDYSHMSIAYSNYKNIIIRNIVHASDSPSNAKREINVVFTEDEIQNYTRSIDDSIY